MPVLAKNLAEIELGGLEELEESEQELWNRVVSNVREDAPVDTGELRNSVGKGGGPLNVRMALHGVAQNADGGAHEGWIDKAYDDAVDAFNGPGGE